MYHFPDGARELREVVKHRVANADVEVQEARNLGYDVRDLLAFVLQVGSADIQGTQDSYCSIKHPVHCSTCVNTD